MQLAGLNDWRDIEPNIQVRHTPGFDLASPKNGNVLLEVDCFTRRWQRVFHQLLYLQIKAKITTIVAVCLPEFSADLLLPNFMLPFSALLCQLMSKVEAGW